MIILIESIYCNRPYISKSQTHPEEPHVLEIDVSDNFEAFPCLIYGRFNCWWALIDPEDDNWRVCLALINAKMCSKR